MAMPERIWDAARVEELSTRLRDRAEVAREEGTMTARRDADHFVEAADAIEELATTHQRALEALREAEKALERFNRGGITLFGNEEDVPITFKGKDFQALRSALARIKEAT